MRTHHRSFLSARLRRHLPDRRIAPPSRRVDLPGQEPVPRLLGLFHWRRLTAEPFVCFLLLFAIMMAIMCIAAVHRTGMSRALLGNWADVRW